MKSQEDLRRALQKIDHKSYGMYKTLGGSYDYGTYILHIDHVQGDPFASPSRLRFEVSGRNHGFPAGYFDTPWRKLALEDQVLRRFLAGIRRHSGGGKPSEAAEREKTEDSRSGGRGRGNMGSGKSGKISTCPAGQKVLPRMAVLFSENKMEVRFEMGFPARGRTILAREMEQLLFRVLPDLASSCLFFSRWDSRSKENLKQAIWLADDQQALREEIVKKRLVAFVADGAILPRESGVSDRPMRGAVPFSSPEELRTEITLPHRGRITGMGVPEGITVIVGGGYHGKSTLLKALEQGVYNHIAGDGREYVISRQDGVKIRAEDGRSVLHTDISMFINHLPGGQNTKDFSSENASGSTSQAANLIEAMEAGSRLLFLDEDTSATNFMIRDKVMAQLVSDDKEPITNLLRHIRGLYETLGVSFVIVVGSSGDYLSAADLVLQMDHYEVKDVTARAEEICEQAGIAGQFEAGPITAPDFSRKLGPTRIGRMKLKAMGTDTVMIDRDVIDVRYLEQLADSGQTIGLAYLMGWILEHQKQEEDLIAVIERLYQQIASRGLESVVPQGYSCGQPVLPRKQELFACISRYRQAHIRK